MNRRDQRAEQRLSVSQRTELERAKRAARWVGLVLPLAALAAAFVLLFVWMPRLPNPAATHWSGSGAPDGFGSPWAYVWIMALAGVGIVLMLWAFVEFGSRAPALSPKRVMPVWSGYQRFLAAFGLGYAVFLAVTMLASVWVQLDLEDARQAGGNGLPMAVAFGVWALVTLLGWLVQPKTEIAAPSEGSAEPLPVKASERFAWFGEVRPSKVFVGVVGSAVLVIIAATVWVCSVQVSPAEQGAMVATRVMMVVVALLMLVLALTSSWFRVRIDEQGLEVRSAIGWPVFRLPADEVQSVEAAQIAPLAEFGGWGMRWAPGRFGIVMRTGEGIIAKRKDGRIFAVTLDDAETAASALAAAAAASERGHAKRGRKVAE